MLAQQRVTDVQGFLQTLVVGGIHYCQRGQEREPDWRVNKIVQVVPEVCPAHLDRPPATRRAPTMARGSAATSAAAEVSPSGPGCCGSRRTQYQNAATATTRHQTDAIAYHCWYFRGWTRAADRRYLARSMTTGGSTRR